MRLPSLWISDRCKAVVLYGIPFLDTGFSGAYRLYRVHPAEIPVFYLS